MKKKLVIIGLFFVIFGSYAQDNICLSDSDFSILKTELLKKEKFCRSNHLNILLQKYDMICVDQMTILLKKINKFERTDAVINNLKYVSDIENALVLKNQCDYFMSSKVHRAIKEEQQQRNKLYKLPKHFSIFGRFDFECKIS